MLRSSLSVFVFLAMSTLGFAQTNFGRVRVLHASPDAPAVDVLVDGAKVWENLPFGGYTAYVQVPAGAREVRVNVSGTTTTVLQATPTVGAQTDYTAIAVGFAGGKEPKLDLMLLVDNNGLPPANNIKIRAVHAAASAPAVDIYATTPFETLDNKTPVLTGVPFKAASDYLVVTPGLYQFRVAVAGTKTIAIDSGAVPTVTNQVRTVVAVDNKGGGAPFSFIVLPDRN